MPWFPSATYCTLADSAFKESFSFLNSWLLLKILCPSIFSSWYTNIYIIDTKNKNLCNEETEINLENNITVTAESGATNNVKLHHLSKKNSLLEDIFMNIVINKSNKSSKNLISRQEIENGTTENLSKGEINIFIPERHLSIDQVILQGKWRIFSIKKRFEYMFSKGEAYFQPDQMEINIMQSPTLESSGGGVHLNVSVPERKLSFTQVVTPTQEKSTVMTPAKIFSVLGVEEDEEEFQGDDMNEMEGPNPGSMEFIAFKKLHRAHISGSIDHFKRLFYPRIPCKNCSSCYRKFWFLNQFKVQVCSIFLLQSNKVSRYFLYRSHTDWSSCLIYKKSYCSNIGDPSASVI